jgi:hypothetical protein
MHGLELGIARYFHQSWSGRITTANLTSPFEGILKSSVRRGVTIPGYDDKDVLKNQLGSVFGRIVLPHSGFEMYAEYGHEDHNADLRDLESEPDHSRVAMIGLRKTFVRSDTAFAAFRAEIIDGSEPTLARHRGEGGVYSHSVLRQGHTQAGQLLGADVGVGSPAGAEVAWDMYTQHGRSSLYLQRIAQNSLAPLLNSESAVMAADQLRVTVGYERHRFGNGTDISYGAALTNAKRSVALPAAWNLNVNLGFAMAFLPRS